MSFNILLIVCSATHISSINSYVSGILGRRFAQAFAWNPNTNNLVNFKCMVRKASAGSLQVELHTYISHMVPPLDELGKLATLINLAMVIIVLIFFTADLRLLVRHVMAVGLDQFCEHPPLVILFYFSCSTLQVRGLHSTRFDFHCI